MEALARFSNASEAFWEWLNDWCSDRRDRQAVLAVSLAVACSVVYKSINKCVTSRELAQKRKEKQEEHQENIIQLKEHLNSVCFIQLIGNDFVTYCYLVVSTCRLRTLSSL